MSLEQECTEMVFRQAVVFPTLATPKRVAINYDYDRDGELDLQLGNNEYINIRDYINSHNNLQYYGPNNFYNAAIVIVAEHDFPSGRPHYNEFYTYIMFDDLDLSGTFTIAHELGHALGGLEDLYYEAGRETAYDPEKPDPDNVMNTNGPLLREDQWGLVNHYYN